MRASHLSAAAFPGCPSQATWPLPRGYAPGQSPGCGLPESRQAGDRARVGAEGPGHTPDSLHIVLSTSSPPKEHKTRSF